MSRMHRKSAAALAYDTPEADGAPRVVAKGYGLVAEMIVQRAKEAGLYVHEAPEMVSLLMRVDLDEKIPPQLYQAVAELLAWLHRLEAGDEAKPESAAEAQNAKPADTRTRGFREIGGVRAARPALPGVKPSTST
jgi:flagellar biosynthesis protein